MINPNQTDYGAAIREWWNQVPSYSKLVLYLSVAGYLLGLAFPMIAFQLINFPKFTVESFQFYRVFTTPFIAINLFQVLFGLLSYMPTACKTEKRLGTISYLFFFMINSEIYTDLLVQVLFVGIMYGTSYIPFGTWSSNVLYPCTGLWPLIMIEMVVRCNRNPDQPTS